MALRREAGRRRVALACQFHESHVLLGTLAQNDLLGRGWPPGPRDIAEAERALRALELGPLLERTPSGILQMVGETGWQSSHGERSRLYIARALLQGADVLILGESFAALDPETLRRTLGFVLEDAPALRALAHRFGEMPAGLRSRLEELKALDALEVLLDGATTCQSLRTFRDGLSRCDS